MALLFLVGYAGSGKSSLGRRLARRMRCRFVDTDNLVEQQEGATIADIFYYEGEEYFRRAERGALESLADSEGDFVVATGGGMPTWSDNMTWMNNHGFTIYISRSAEHILSRLTEYGREKRPMFRGKSDEELITFMRAQMAEREQFYAMANVRVECDARSDDDVVEYIVNQLDKDSNE